ncbi:hypothetical protein MA20_01435 [Bradyrhizobium japonicum]|uniref:Uncharacterized protein n=1 Tax=Bradyrhizobium japonicum TaxID=375 RepID=A0A0A3Y7T5_BRAJP|nr:hypothetical protein [Bradyrhizobium japonicum]KGT81441.1 hypothetical protein MA20_01435 [Bradyrhizobium japonicum]MCS3893795.1 hypothetical protein [Bradyrhizobium japonicum USDA 38]MCS3946309.1 hypothetical protein [Bradyrhizobium japonicum]MCW2221371.1 hypothetical protein [Bradyrhizobium japonicum]MCW2345983.1 hypothetical protein [Bradyrhizobium japonicum]
MHRPTTATVLAASLLLAATARAQAPQSFRVISPIFGQLVSFAMPSDFVAVFENTKGGHYIREAVLKGETPERWTQMITVTGEKGMTLTPGASPERFAGTIAGGFKTACPDSFAAQPLGAMTFGRVEGFVAVIGCGRVDSGPTRHSETMLLITLKGITDYYTIQWAERGPESDEPPVNDERWQTRLRDLGPIDLCPIVAGEAAPYPSCVDKS